MFSTLEHVPELGESVELGGWRFTAEEVDGRRIQLVRVSPSSRRRSRRRAGRRDDAPTADLGAEAGATTFAAPWRSRWQGKVALVTGASKGIGKAIAKGFADAGAKVMLSSRKIDELEAAADGDRR